MCRQSQEQHNVFSNLGMHLKWFNQKHVVLFCEWDSGLDHWTGLQDAPKFDLCL